MLIWHQATTSWSRTAGSSWTRWDMEGGSQSSLSQVVKLLHDHLFVVEGFKCPSNCVILGNLPLVGFHKMNEF